MVMNQILLVVLAIIAVDLAVVALLRARARAREAAAGAAGPAAPVETISGQPLNAYERFLKRSQEVITRVDNVLNLIFSAEYNFWYFHAGLTNLFLWFCIATGFLVFFYYVPSFEGAYASVEYLTREVPYGAIIRGLHRYSADGLAIAVLLHISRVYFTDRFRKFRSMTWVSGVFMLVLTLIAGITGYLLVWDQRSLLLTGMTRDLLAAFPLVGGWLANFFLGGPVLNTGTLPRFLFFHIMPAFLFMFFLWWHYVKINRPVIYPPGPLVLIGLGLVIVASAVYPATSQPPANFDAPAGELMVDWFFLWGYPLLNTLTPTVVALLALLVVGGLFAVPYFPKSRWKNVPVVHASKCTGCNLCYVDCHANAIEMIPDPYYKGKRTKLLAVVYEPKCAECGICVGACPFGAIEMPLLRDKTVEDAILSWVQVPTTEAGD